MLVCDLGLGCRGDFVFDERGKGERRKGKEERSGWMKKKGNKEGRWMMDDG